MNSSQKMYLQSLKPYLGKIGSCDSAERQQRLLTSKNTQKKIDPSEIMQRGGVFPYIYEFTVERPIEFAKKGDKKPTLTIPLAWYK